MKSFRTFFLGLFLIFSFIEAYSGEKRPFLLIESNMAQEPDRSILPNENFKILNSLRFLGFSNSTYFIILKNRDRFVKKKLKLDGEVVKSSDIESLLNWESIDNLIGSDSQNLIEIDLPLKKSLQNLEVAISCLDLSGSEMGDDLAITLAEKLLPQLIHLTHLILRNCRIGPRAARAFAQVMGENPELVKKLQWADFSRNQLNMSGVVIFMIIFIFNENSPLEILSFDCANETSFLRRAECKALTLSSSHLGKPNEVALKKAAAQAAKGPNLGRKDKILMKKNDYGILSISGLNVECMEILEPVLKNADCFGFSFSTAGKVHGMDLIQSLDSKETLFKKHLKELNLSNSLEVTKKLSSRIAERIKNISIKFSITCLKLSRVDFFHYMIIDLSKELLENNHTLKELHLDENLIDDDGAIKIAKALEVNQFLKKLNLSKNIIGDRGSNALAKALMKNRKFSLELNLSYNEIFQVEEWVKLFNLQLISIGLDLSYNKICEKWKKLLQPFVQLDSDLSRFFIVSLDFKKFDRLIEQIKNGNQLSVNGSGNQIGDEEVCVLEKALKNNDNLKNLDLSNNQIGNIGAVVLSKALKSNIFLKVLNLSNNQIKDVGVSALVKELENHVYFEMFYLINNQIGDLGAIVIANALKNNTSLKLLDLSNNQIRYPGAKVLMNLFEENKNLEVLNLEGNSIDYLKI